MRGLFRFLTRRTVVLAVFLTLKLVAVIINGLTINSNEVWGIGILAMLTYAVISWFAYKRQIISIWAITIIMLYEGSGALLTGLKQFGSAPAIGILGITIAVYMVLGALVIFSSRHIRE